MKQFTATPEEFATGGASIKAMQMFRGTYDKKPRKKYEKRKQLDRQIGTITSKAFGTGEAYMDHGRSNGHRKFKSACIKPMAESIVDRLLS